MGMDIDESRRDNMTAGIDNFYFIIGLTDILINLFDNGTVYQDI